MKKYRLLFFLVLALLFYCIVPFAGAQNLTGGEAFIKIEGEVTQPLTLYASDLALMQRAEVRVADREGKETTYSGVPVTEILQKAGATLGCELRGENLSKYLLIRAADGYEVLFSLAELDSAFTDRVVILADRADDKPLPAGKGPFRIIVPGEKKPARCIFEVTTLVVGFAKE